MSTDSRGEVITVLGPVEPAVLGPTLIHEHVFIDISCYYVPPKDGEGQRLSQEFLAMENLGWVRQNSMSSKNNLHLDNAQTAITELGRFKAAGGGTLVDATPIGIGRDPIGLRTVAEQTGLHIVAGSGYYIATSHPPEVAAWSAERLAEEIYRDVIEGIGATNVRAGLIGEIGTSWPLHPDEEKVLRAAARVQKQTGAPMSIHPGMSPEAPMRLVAILKDEGTNLRRVIICHIEARYRAAVDDYARLADTGCNLGFDTFGREQYFELVGRQHPNDDQRIDVIAELCRRGYSDRIMVSQDVCYRADLCAYGGHGYGHILRYIVPRLSARGVSDSDIERILVTNPARFLVIQ